MTYEINRAWIHLITLLFYNKLNDFETLGIRHHNIPIHCACAWLNTKSSLTISNMNENLMSAFIESSPFGLVIFRTIVWSTVHWFFLAKTVNVSLTNLTLNPSRMYVKGNYNPLAGYYYQVCIKWNQPKLIDFQVSCFITLHTLTFNI